MKGTCALTIVIAGLATAGAAQDRESNVLYTTGYIDSQSSVSGGGVEVEWLRRLSRASVLVGGASASADTLWWTYGTAGTFLRRDRVIVSARSSLGQARYNGDGSVFLRMTGNVTVPITHGLYGEVEAQHARLLGAATTTLGVGGSFIATTHVSARLMYRVSQSASAPDVRSIAGRADLMVGDVSLFGGASLTAAERSRESAAVDLLTHPSHEVFAGSSFPAAFARVICALQVVPTSAGRFSRLTTTLQIPIARRSISAADPVH